MVLAFEFIAFGKECTFMSIMYLAAMSINHILPENAISGRTSMSISSDVNLGKIDVGC